MSSNLPAKYASVVEQDLKKDQEIKTGGNQSMSFAQGQMNIGETNYGNGPIPFYIVGACRVNAWYSKPYDPKSIASPDCWAIFNDDTEEPIAKPDVTCLDKQCDGCLNCAKNAWGSAPNGRKGKACQNSWRLALIMAGGWDKDKKFQLFNAAGLQQQNLIFCRLPVTSGKNFANFVKHNASPAKGGIGRPKYFYATAISTKLNPNTQFEVNFELYHVPNDEDILDVLFQLKTTAQEDVKYPFVQTEVEPVEQKKVANKVRM